MRVVVRIIDGPEAGRRFLLASGQIAQIGSTEWADFALPADRQLADVHFSLHVQPSGCLVRKAGEAEVLVNGEPAAEAMLQSGDRVFAGRSLFQVDIEGALRGAADRPPESQPKEQHSGNSKPDNDQATPTIARRAALSEQAIALLAGNPSPGEFVAALLDAELLADAARFRAAELPQLEAVRWASQCVRRAMGEKPSAQDAAALDTAEAWADQPDEEKRRAAEGAALALDNDRPAKYAALAAFWSGDNMAPQGLPAAPIPPDLYLQGVAGAVLLAAAWAGAETMGATMRAFLSNGASSPAP